MRGVFWLIIYEQTIPKIKNWENDLVELIGFSLFSDLLCDLFCYHHMIPMLFQLFFSSGTRTFFNFLKTLQGYQDSAVTDCNWKLTTLTIIIIIIIILLERLLSERYSTRCKYCYLLTIQNLFTYINYTTGILHY